MYKNFEVLLRILRQRIFIFLSELKNNLHILNWKNVLVYITYTILNLLNILVR